MRYILHQLWFPPQQVLFAFALARALKDEASTKKFVSKDSDVPRALIKAALKLMPINLTGINKAAKEARTELPASKHSAAWLLRRATIPGLLISLHGDKHTAEWVRGAWISDDEGWAALIAAGSSYKHMLRSARSLLELLHVFQADDDKEVSKRRELFVASVEPSQRALGQLPGVGPYVKVHAPRTMLACELTGEENAALLRNLPDEWLNQNNSGESQKTAYTALTDAYRITNGLSPLPTTKKDNIFRASHRDFIGPGSFVRDILVAGTYVDICSRGLGDNAYLRMFQALGVTSTGCLLCEANSAIKDLTKDGDSIDYAIELMNNLMLARSGSFHTLREEIHTHGGMTAWALAQLIKGLEKRKAVNKAGIAQLRRSQLVNEQGVVAIGAKDVVRELFPRLKACDMLCSLEGKGKKEKQDKKDKKGKKEKKEKKKRKEKVKRRRTLDSFWGKSAVTDEDADEEDRPAKLFGVEVSLDVAKLLPVETFFKVIGFLFDTRWTKGSCAKTANREDKSLNADVGTLAHLRPAVKRSLYASLYYACAEDVRAEKFDMSTLTTPLQNAVGGEGTPEDLELLDRTRSKLGRIARKFLSERRMEAQSRKTALNDRKKGQVFRLRASLQECSVLGSAEQCIAAQSNLSAQGDDTQFASLRKRIESAAYVLTTHGEHAERFEGDNASHRPESILCVLEGPAVRDHLPSAYDLDEVTVGRQHSDEKRAMVVELRVVDVSTPPAESECLRIYYSGVHHVACSANTLVSVWSLVAAQNSYHAIKEKAEIIVNDPEQDADDPDFATFMCAEKREGFAHGRSSLCIHCAAYEHQQREFALKPQKKRKRKKTSRQR